MRFSQRMGFTPVKDKIQKDGMDDDLRTGLWNVFYSQVLDDVRGHRSWQNSAFYDLIIAIWQDFWCVPLDSLPGDSETVYAHLQRYWYEEKPWYKNYDFIQFVAEHMPWDPKQQFIRLCNKRMERELSAYRFIGDKIGPITDDVQITAIEDALRDSSPLAGVNAHLHDALEKLTDRENPDHRNSIKESISAVESIACTVSGIPKGTLGQAISKLSDHGIDLHPALQEAWQRLYGYTSDKEGIRHKLMELPDITFADAQYMLVSCSAFVSYLTDLCRQAGITLSP